MAFEGYKYKFELRAGHPKINGGMESRHFHNFIIILYLKDMDNNVNLYEEIENVVNRWLRQYENKYLDETDLFADTPEKGSTMENMGNVFFDKIGKITYDFGFELIKLEIGDSPIRMYGVSNRILDSSANELSTLPFIIRPEVKLENEKEAVEQVVSHEETIVAENESEIVVEANLANDQENVDDSTPETTKSIIKNVSAMFIATLVLFVGAAAIIWCIVDSGWYPRGDDTFCHLYRADLILQNIKEGNIYPLYDMSWYNGVEVMRYWGPVPLYILALFEAVTSSMLESYLAFIGFCFIIGGFGWLIVGKRYKCLWLSLIMAFVWFFLPENNNVMVIQGNLPRALINAILPYAIYMLLCYFEEKKTKYLAGIVVLTALMGLSHIGTTLMVVALFAIYSLIYCKSVKCKGVLQVLLAMVTGLLIIGVWMVPSFIGGMTSSSSSNQTAATQFQDLFQTLNPMDRINGQLDLMYFGISVVVISIFGIFIGTRKTRAGFLTAIIILLCTTETAFTVVKELPISKFLWMQRLVPIALGLFVMSILMWKNLKRYVVIIMSLLLVLDCASSIHSITVFSESKVEDPSAALDSKADTYLLNDAKDVAAQRIAVFDLSRLGAFLPYYISGVGNKKMTVFGAGWEGAKTASNIVRLNESISRSYFNYAFDRSIELGSDVVVVLKSALESRDTVLEELEEAAANTGFKLIKSNQTALLYKYDIDGTFGNKAEYNNLAIGSAAKDVAMVFPDYKEGWSNSLDDYSVEELAKYKTVYLSNVEYANSNHAEEKIRAVAGKGTKVIIDMNRIPANINTNNPEIFGVSAHNIHFKDAFPNIVFDGQTYKMHNFVEEYNEWSTVYLAGLDNVTGYSKVNNKVMPMAGSISESDNIIFLGFNIVYHLEVSRDEAAQSIIENIFGERMNTLPVRNVVPIDISYENNKIVVRSDEDYVNTSLAYLDILESEQELIFDNNLIEVRKGETVISIHYPHIWKGLLVTILGLGVIMVYVLFYRRAKLKGGSYDEKTF